MPTRRNIKLVPWDHQSEAHVARAVAQRKACGWGESEVPTWVEKSSKGSRFMYWIVLANDHADQAEMLQKHIDKYPDESIPLHDTCKGSNLLLHKSVGDFIPVGHVALKKDATPDLTGHAEKHLPPDAKFYWITSLYVTDALQGLGLGRSAMYQLESLVARSTTKETLLILDTIPTAFQLSDWSYKYFMEPKGLPMPKQSNQQWYEQQGYEIFATLPDHRFVQLPMDVSTLVTVLLLRKAITGQQLQ
ncbi:hypothetical protein GGR57DRAFT_496294 [Xylariaceae sp. FL1272]|nr:hypothetical protein GGR57DRAFT_496294 [Xylariaceae sp. FL1272]